MEFLIQFSSYKQVLTLGSELDHLAPEVARHFDAIARGGAHVLVYAPSLTMVTGVQTEKMELFRHTYYDMDKVVQSELGSGVDTPTYSFWHELTEGVARALVSKWKSDVRRFLWGQREGGLRVMFCEEEIERRWPSNPVVAGTPRFERPDPV